MGNTKVHFGTGTVSRFAVSSQLNEQARHQQLGHQWVVVFLRDGPNEAI
jgi:hypothetical protein